VEKDRSTFTDIPNAAKTSGFSVRHFRRMIREDGVRIVQIGRKFFILTTDLEKWKKEKNRKM
jgi:excisionase family DNA binding protein